MKIKLIANTQPVFDVNTPNFSKTTPIGLVGRFANVCYMAGSMTEVMEQGEFKAMKRAYDCNKNGHHSVFDHLNLTMTIEGIPKIIAMLLNGFNLYATSEKSSRYCRMFGLSENDHSLYVKWIDKLKPIVTSIDGDLNESQINKIAMENAKYFISIFSPCTDMVYSTNIRQLSYVYERLIEYHKFIVDESNKNRFNSEFINLLQTPLLEFIKGLYSEILNTFDINIKDSRINFSRVFPFMKLNVMNEGIKNIKDEAGYTYCVKHDMSFNCLSHKQRSRILHHTFYLKESPNFVVPNLIKNNEELIEEWKEDMKSVQNIFPQGMKVTVIERGMTEDFFKYQVTERMCTRAFYETYAVVKRQALIMQCLILQNDNVDEEFKAWCSTFFEDGKVCSKCKMIGCASPCRKKLHDRIL